MNVVMTQSNLKPSLYESMGSLDIALPKIKQKYPRHVVSGTTIDAIADKNMKNITSLEGERDNLKAELKEVRLLNEKLYQRVDFL